MVVIALLLTSAVLGVINKYAIKEKTVESTSPYGFPLPTHELEKCVNKQISYLLIL